ncbi:hypothetical protein [Streptomyces rishiriensis]|uniref:hypothetical protein n=1 Tax=Streptomyces rishiriensis TaxID=68264 RepID=UPI0037D31F75
MTPEETFDVAFIAFDSAVAKGGRTAQGSTRSSVPLGRAHRLQGRVLVGAGLVLLPWLGYLAGTLPAGEATAWVALDALEAAALLTAGSRVLRADDRLRAPAAAAAILLVADACIDLVSCAGGPELPAAVAMAVMAELPLAVLSAALAVRPPRRYGRSADGSAALEDLVRDRADRRPGDPAAAVTGARHR